ncbi:LOW QUALITY PROTEIN: ribonucleases P/MRP protein subunit POP1-like [Phalaenopsis equestris]|uniref:LOW QUALITY PROTEIN: ribonucleases P/MRP protein subunit POP1-like n=1 Tax=Phalaenopsis equestris TaxID=78828 RepID=UPI0009E2F51B|nr:LOW QUALITY PROTEIN: ribonucleases P/MRP protein subunit POP1-like [Phalaenopsis equestris]
MVFSPSYKDSKPVTMPLNSSAHPPLPPRLLLINKFAESRAPELESLHSIVSKRLNHDFRMRRDKRRRTTSFHSGKNRRQKRPRLIDIAVNGTEAGDLDKKEADRPPRWVRRRIELRRNPTFGFCLSGDGTKRLRTHLWHAKRFSMVKRWGFYLPLGLQGRGRGSKAVLKWLKSGALIHDASYTLPVQLEGPQESILDVMRMVLRPFPSGSSEQMSKPVIYGACYANSMLYDVRSLLLKFIAPVTYMWLPLKRGEIYFDSGQIDAHSSFSRSEGSACSRQLWIWLHPASYREGFNALSYACQKEMNETGTSVHCLSMEGHIARLEVIGANSLKILQNILIPVTECPSIGSQALLPCSSLRVCSNSQLNRSFVLEHADHLPSHAIFPLEVQDPRNLPVNETNIFPKTASFAGCPQHQGPVHDSSVSCSEESSGNKDLLLSFWSKPETNGVFLSDCRQLWDSYINLKPPLPENIVCKDRHCKRLKQFYLDPSHSEESGGEARVGYDQTVPIVLLRHPEHGTFTSGWSVILPLSWVKTFWISLVLNNAHAIGLREKRWIACNGGLPSFPYDFPDSSAYTSLVAAEAAEADEAAKLRPPAVRPISFPLASPWHCVAHTLHRGFNTCESCYTARRKAHGMSFSVECRDSKQSSDEHASDPFIVSILRTTNNLNHIFEKASGEGYLDQVGGPLFVRVLIHAFKEGSFEAGAVVCAPALADLPTWMSRS